MTVLCTSIWKWCCRNVTSILQLVVFFALIFPLFSPTIPLFLWNAHCIGMPSWCKTRTLSNSKISMGRPNEKGSWMGERQALEQNARHFKIALDNIMSVHSARAFQRTTAASFIFSFSSFCVRVWVCNVYAPVHPFHFICLYMKRSKSKHFTTFHSIPYRCWTTRCCCLESKYNRQTEWRDGAEIKMAE